MNGTLNQNEFDPGDTLKVDATGKVINEFNVPKYFRMSISAFEVGNPNNLVSSSEQTVLLNPGDRRAFALTLSHVAEEPFEQYHFVVSLVYLDAVGGLEAPVSIDSDGVLFELNE